jgi:hypothetical protein
MDAIGKVDLEHLEADAGTRTPDPFITSLRRSR